jgi:hypothetical protein
VDFANRFVANFLSGQIRRLRFFLGALGVMGLATGLWSIYSGTVHTANGVEASAVLLERMDRCKAEFQIKGESRRNEAMPCDQAYALLKMAGSKKVRVTKKTFATVRYPMADGSERTATVEESTVQTRSLPIGSRFDAVYDPQNPGDVRAKLSLAQVEHNLLFVGGGLLLLALAFLPQVLRFFTSAEGNRTAAAEQNPEQGTAASWGDGALTRAALASRERPAAVSAKSAGPATFGMRGKAAAAGGRRQFGVRA